MPGILSGHCELCLLTPICQSPESYRRACPAELRGFKAEKAHRSAFSEACCEASRPITHRPPGIDAEA